MMPQRPGRGGAPVGFVSELDPIEAAAVAFLRHWADQRTTGDGSNRGDDPVSPGFRHHAASDHAEKTFHAFCSLLARHGRRPLMRHAIGCRCLGADEACFANLVAEASQGAREDAMLLATLMVRPDVAPALTELARDFGLALCRMALSRDRLTDRGPGDNRPDKTYH